MFGVLEGYCDESINPKNSLLVVAGYVGEAIQWQRLILEWESEFAQAKITHLHLTDLRSPKSSLYKHLPMERRKELLIALTRSIRFRLSAGMVVSVYQNEYNKVTSQRLRSQFGSAYTACGIVAVSTYSAKMKERDRHDPVNWVFEQGHASAGGLIQGLLEVKTNNPRIGTVTLGEKVKLIPLQVADLLAFARLESLSGVAREPDLIDLVKPMPPTSPNGFWTGPDYEQFHLDQEVIEKGIVGYVAGEIKRQREMKAESNNFNKEQRLFKRQFAQFTRKMRLDA